jgi:hypothetical protein
VCTVHLFWQVSEADIASVGDLLSAEQEHRWVKDRFDRDLTKTGNASIEERVRSRRNQDGGEEERVMKTDLTARHAFSVTTSTMIV